MKSSMKIGVFVFIFLFGRLVHVSADPTSDSLYQILSLSVSAIITRLDKMESKMESKITSLETRVETLETMSPHLQHKSSIEADADNQDIINSNAIRKMLADEKSIIRDTIREMGQQFYGIKEELQKSVSKINESLEVKASNMLDIVSNSSVALDTGMALLKHDLNTTIREWSQVLEVNLEKQENDTRNDMSMLETSFQSHTGDQLSSIRTNMMSLSSKLSSISSSEIRRSSSLSSQMSYASSSLSSLASRGYLMSSSLSSMSYWMSSSMSSLSSRIYEEEEQKVGFTARLDNADIYYNPNETIKFNYVVYNHGNGYSSSTGYFTAPKSGTYLFVFTIQSGEKENAQAQIMVNGNYKVDAAANEGYNTGTNAVLQYVYSGQNVWVQLSQFESKYYLYAYRTTFSGVLID